MLSREEFSQLLNNNIRMDVEFLESELGKARKETAEKIFDMLYQWLDLEELGKHGYTTIRKIEFLRKFREIYKQFGVEIKE